MWKKLNYFFPNGASYAFALHQTLWFQRPVEAVGLKCSLIALQIV